jgi:hypothetical protein
MDSNANSGTGGASTRVRRLTTHQIAVLVQVLLSFSDQRVGVCHDSSSSDAAAYAEDFVAVFKALNWTVDSFESTRDFVPSASGLAIVASDQRLPPSAEALRDALRIYQLEADTVRDRIDLCGPRAFVLAVS